MTSIKPQLFRYWLAMNASAFDAAVHSCAAYFGVAGVHAAAAAVPALTWPQFAAVFLITFGRAILAYLDAHPVAELLPVAQAFQPAGSRDIPVPCSGASAAPELATGKSPEPAGWKACATDATTRVSPADSSIVNRQS